MVRENHDDLICELWVRESIPARVMSKDHVLFIQNELEWALSEEIVSPRLEVLRTRTLMTG